MSRVILSTDIGSDIDDAISLLVQLNSGIELDGVVTVNGDVLSRAYIAKHMIDLANKKVPVVIGESTSIADAVKPYSHYEDIIVPDRFFRIPKRIGNVEEKDMIVKPDSVGVLRNGVEFLAEELLREPAVIFSIGPLTNIARLFTHYAEPWKNIERLYVMGCSFTDNHQEHNIVYDPTAAGMVFSSDIPISVIPWETCERYKLSLDVLQQVISPQAGFVYSMARAFAGTMFARKLLGDVPEHFIERMKMDVSGNEKIQQLERENKKLSLNDFIFEMSSLGNSDISKLSSEVKDQIEAQHSWMRRKVKVSLVSEEFAVRDPDEYWANVDDCVDILKNELRHRFGGVLAELLEYSRPKDVFVSDAFVPYVFLYPDKVQRNNCNIRISPTGESFWGPGNKHDVITSVDYDHFDDFMRRFVR